MSRKSVSYTLALLMSAKRILQKCVSYLKELGFPDEEIEEIIQFFVLKEEQKDGKLDV